jgi:general secretion pathway protein I
MIVQTGVSCGARKFQRVRPGLSLLEVLTALAIFLISLIALGQLVTLSGERALEVERLSRASQLSQSKLAEVVSGAVSLSSQSGDFDEDPDWHYQVEAEQDSAITGLWRVQVKVSRDMGNGTTMESTVSQMVLDPSLRGSASDAIPSPTSGNTGAQAGGTTPGAAPATQTTPMTKKGS